MKVAVYYRNDYIRIEERPLPHIVKGEILVKMMASGICGTDIMQWYRVKQAPRVLGHEMAGEVVDKGRGVRRFKKGDRVFVSHHVPCYKCHYCLKRKYTACESFHKGNFDPGGFSEYIRVPEEHVKHGTFILPRGITFEHATMIEPLGCVIAGQNRLEMKQGQSVFVIGTGVSGILHIQLAKSKGCTVIATDINKYRLRKALELGADYIVYARDYSVDVLRKINNNRLADIVIISTSAKQAVDYAISSVDRKGEILFFAIPDSNIIVPSSKFWRDEITVTFSYGASPCDIKKAIELIKNKKINVNAMITHRIPLSDIQKGFKIASESKNSLKVVIIPDNKA